MPNENTGVVGAATPDPPAGGPLSTTVTPAAGATPTVPWTPPPAPAGAAGGGGTIQLPEADYRKLLEDKHIADAARQAEAVKAQKAEGERLKTLVEKEGLDAALKQLRDAQAEAERKHREEVKEYQARLLGHHKRTEVGRELLGVTWVSGAGARQAEALMAEKFETVEDGGRVVTRQIGTGKTPAEAIPDLLKTEEFLHFQAGKAGGAGAGATNRSGDTAATDPGQRAREIIAQALEARSSDAIGLSGVGRVPSKN